MSHDLIFPASDQRTRLIKPVWLANGQSLLSNVPVGTNDPANFFAYGGYLVAETLAPHPVVRSLLENTLRMRSLLRGYRSWYQRMAVPAAAPFAMELEGLALNTSRLLERIEKGIHGDAFDAERFDAGR